MEKLPKLVWIWSYCFKCHAGSFNTCKESLILTAILVVIIHLIKSEVLRWLEKKIKSLLEYLILSKRSSRGWCCTYRCTQETLNPSLKEAFWHKMEEKYIFGSRLLITLLRNTVIRGKQLYILFYICNYYFLA